MIKYLKCTKNKKKLLQFGISKDQFVRIELEAINLVAFTEKTKTRYIKLPSKLMKYFKEVQNVN